MVASSSGSQIIYCYSPVNVSDKETVSDFLRELSILIFICTLLKHNIVIIAVVLYENTKLTHQYIINRTVCGLEYFISGKRL